MRCRHAQGRSRASAQDNSIINNRAGPRANDDIIITCHACARRRITAACEVTSPFHSRVMTRNGIKAWRSAVDCVTCPGDGDIRTGRAKAVDGITSSMNDNPRLIIPHRPACYIISNASNGITLSEVTNNIISAANGVTKRVCSNNIPKTRYFICRGIIPQGIQSAINLIAKIIEA